MLKTKNSITLTVMFEGQFWVGIFERESDDGYSVARVVLGGEPTEAELFHFLLYQCDALKFSAPVEDATSVIRKVNPKRAIREAKKLQESGPAMTKAYDVMRLELEKNKKVRKEKNKAEREEEEKLRFELKQKKKKEKLRGH